MLGTAAHFGHLPFKVVSGLCIKHLVCAGDETYTKMAAPRGTAKSKAPTYSRQFTLGSFDVANSDLAGAAIFLRVKRDLLAFIQTAHTSPLKGCCMDEDVLAAIVWLNESKAFLIVVEFYSTDLHESSFDVFA